MKSWILGSLLALSMLMPAAVSAHDGHAHKVMGVIDSVQGNHLSVKTTDGKAVMVMIDDKTVVTRGSDKLDKTALKVGERVVAEGMEEKAMVMAKTVKLGAKP